MNVVRVETVVKLGKWLAKCHKSANRSSTTATATRKRKKKMKCRPRRHLRQKDSR
ncbi:unnamed protein product, partial [Symbiodinium necroappetens]